MWRGGGDHMANQAEQTSDGRPPISLPPCLTMTSSAPEPHPWVTLREGALMSNQELFYKMQQEGLRATFRPQAWRVGASTGEMVSWAEKKSKLKEVTLRGLPRKRLG